MAKPEKKTQETFKFSEEQVRRAVQEAPKPMFLQAEDGKVLQISRFWTRLTGYCLAEIPTFDTWITKSVYDVADRVRDHMHNLFDGHESSMT